MFTVTGCLELVYALYAHFLNLYVTLDHKTSLKSMGYVCCNSQKYILWVKIINFYFMPKIIRVLSRDHVPWRHFCKFLTVNISKLHFLLVICIAKNFIWTTLKAIFSIFRFFFTPSDSRYVNSCISAKYCPILTNHTSMESLFVQLLDGVYISILKNWHLRLVLSSKVTYHIQYALTVAACRGRHSFPKILR